MPDYRPTGIKSRPEPAKPRLPGLKGVPEPQRGQKPPLPGEEVPRTVKGNYPPRPISREKPRGSTDTAVGGPPPPRQNPAGPLDRERGTPHTLGEGSALAYGPLVLIIFMLLTIVLVNSL